LSNSFISLAAISATCLSSISYSNLSSLILCSSSASVGLTAPIRFPSASSKFSILDKKGKKFGISCLASKSLTSIGS